MSSAPDDRSGVRIVPPWSYRVACSSASFFTGDSRCPSSRPYSLGRIRLLGAFCLVAGLALDIWAVRQDLRRGAVYPFKVERRHRPIAHTMPPVEQLVGVVQEASTDLGRLATAVNHRLEVAAEMSPAELSQLDPAVTGEPVADDDPSGDLAEDLTGRTAGSARACSRRPRGPARGEPGTGCADGGRAVRHAACPRRRRAAVI